MDKNTLDIEYCNPFNEDLHEFWMKIEHFGRYLYASDIAVRNDVEVALDIACANGYGCRELAKVAKKVIGIDKNDEILSQTEQSFLQNGVANIELLACDIEKACISDLISQKVDLITSFETLEHINTPKQVIMEYFKLLKEDGILLISIPNLKYETLDDVGSPRNPYHKKVFKLQEFVTMLEEIGFSIIKVLSQPYTNIFLNREIDLLERGCYEKEFISSLYNHSEEAIRYFSLLMAYPKENDIDDSYSIIIEAKK